MRSPPRRHDLAGGNAVSASEGEARYVPSRFLNLTHGGDGELVVFSSRTGALGIVPGEKAGEARSSLLANAEIAEPLSAIQRDLVDGGFLVRQDLNELALARADYQHRYTDRRLQLIVMPTEHCNFRCVYCYESFIRGQMSDELVSGIEKFVADQDDVEALTLNWFGGEPLLARGVVVRLTSYMRDLMRRRGAEFRCAATTNGYLLTPDCAEDVIAAGLDHFQVSLDGTEHDHNERRVGEHGEKTFAQILDNLRYLKASEFEFAVTIRHNFDPQNIARVEEFCQLLADEFAGDDRFGLELQPIGKWGGPGDDDLIVCDGRSVARSLVHAKQLALQYGLPDAETREVLTPAGATCYAANPRSFVIGSDGSVYKCTVELDYHDRNVVGRLHPDGHMELDWSKVALWCETDGMHEGSKCTNCHFGGSCWGAICPKEWMDEADCNCPKVKQAIGESLRLIAEESLFARVRT